jgi:hypothetical protein
MQMLVYENYNKFVTATDTIKVMNSSMGGMDTNMNSLKGLIGEDEGHLEPLGTAFVIEQSVGASLRTAPTPGIPAPAQHSILRAWCYSVTAGGRDACADGVVERSNAVNSKLQHRQENIEELNQVRLLLQKLQVRVDTKSLCAP